MEEGGGEGGYSNILLAYKEFSLDYMQVSWELTLKKHVF